MSVETHVRTLRPQSEIAVKLLDDYNRKVDRRTAFGEPGTAGQDMTDPSVGLIVDEYIPRPPGYFVSPIWTSGTLRTLRIRRLTRRNGLSYRERQRRGRAARSR